MKRILSLIGVLFLVVFLGSCDQLTQSITSSGGDSEKNVFVVEYDKDSITPNLNDQQKIYDFFNQGKIRGERGIKFTFYVKKSEWEEKIEWYRKEFIRIQGGTDLKMSLGIVFSSISNTAIFVRNGYGSSTTKIKGVNFVNEFSPELIPQINNLLITNYPVVDAFIYWVRVYDEDSAYPNNTDTADWRYVKETCEGANCVVIISNSPSDEPIDGNIKLCLQRKRIFLEKTGLNKNQVEIIINGVHNCPFPTIQIGQLKNPGKAYYSGRNKYVRINEIDDPEKVVETLRRHF